MHALDAAPSPSDPKITPPTPAPLTAITAQFPTPLPVEPLVTVPAKETSAAPSHAPVIVHTMWGWVMPSVVFVAVVFLVLYVTPYLLMHWRVQAAQADGEVAYHKRRAEL